MRCRESLTHASISWRLRFSLVTDVEYTLTAIPQLQRKECGKVSIGGLMLGFSCKESRSQATPGEMRGASPLGYLFIL